ncbi:hypothetical protein EAH77_08780 [Ewingella americana]|uniref:Uncharacterized protein n=1 Tax=Ewingella americana TaxID=41202 RepID=A0A502GL49_9GAMM|nr:hypothetical protein [Ewingella americana]TPG62575.1 hypothetical protein EAH77_08780 [Ewingella americana]
MELKNRLASISADTSLIEEKLERLLEVFPDHISDELFGMATGLLNKIVLMNSPIAVIASSPFNILYL